MGRANSVRDFFLNDVRRIFELMSQQEGWAPPVNTVEISALLFITHTDRLQSLAAKVMIRASLSVYGRQVETGE